MVGDMSSSCPLPSGKVSGVGCCFPAISKNLTAFLYGWLPLSDAFGIFSLLRGMTKTKGNDRISVTPLGFFLLTHSNHAGVSLRSTTCLWSRQPFGLFTLVEINIQGFRYAPPPAGNLNPLGDYAFSMFDV